MYIKILLGLFVCYFTGVGCNTKQVKPPRKLSATFVVKDSIQFEEKDSTIFSNIFYAKKKNKWIGLLGIARPGGSHPILRLYDTKGEFFLDIDGNKLKKGKRLGIRDFDITDEYIYIFTSKIIFKLNHKGKVLSKISFKLNDKKHFQLSDNYFSFNEEENVFILKTFAHPEESTGNQADYFEKSNPIFYVIDTLGNQVVSFAEYPHAYFDKNLFDINPSLVSNTDKNYIYNLFHSDSTIYQYNLKGRLVKKIKIPTSKYLNYQIKAMNTHNSDNVMDWIPSTIEDKMIAYNDRYQNIDVFPNLERVKIYTQSRNKSINDRIIKTYGVLDYSAKNNTYSEVLMPTNNRVVLTFLNHVNENNKNEIMYFEGFKNQNKRLIIGKIVSEKKK